MPKDFKRKKEQKLHQISHHQIKCKMQRKEGMTREVENRRKKMKARKMQKVKVKSMVINEKK